MPWTTCARPLGQERQIQHHDPHTLIPLLTTERIRRAAHLGDAIVCDLTAHEVNRETPGIDRFFASVHRMHQLLADLFKDTESLRTGRFLFCTLFSTNDTYN